MTAPDGAGRSAAVVTVRVLQPVRANEPRTYTHVYAASDVDHQLITQPPTPTVAWPKICEGQGCSGAGNARWSAVPANILEPERRCGKYRWPQVERWHRSVQWTGTKVCRYNWHSAGSLGWPFPVLKYKYIVFKWNNGSNFIKQHSETTTVWN